jgi:hypothetical protein
VANEHNLKPWPKGISGNPAGRPVGSGTVFSQKFIRDFTVAWRERGIATMMELSVKNPSAFLMIASRLVPQQMQAEVVQPQVQTPGNLSAGEW